MIAASKAIVEVVDRVDFGRPSARKTGRNVKWPYVPVVVVNLGNVEKEEQILGRAFATRPEAVAYAERTIAARRADLATKLSLPQYRALRRWHGLPEELP